MSEEVNLDIVEAFITQCNVEGDSEISLKTNGLTKNAIEDLLKMYYNERNIIQNIREEILKYDWINSNKTQIYNQLKDLYEAIFCKELTDDDPLLCKRNKRSEYSKRYYEKHKEERKAYQRKYQKEHYKPKIKE